ncbi:alpha/beta hydrolase [Roseomonas hellenica]|uniref:Alpha/beta hydrolase n=1 Tax=Plastoroseomonas hellenica TaxID=2687306 RepID=A0ABS5F4X5_9PROT|nr:alpha/beta hydrolase [Plastoroseomonas hellenica]MBR0667603.1 alpha/beta hydrolase [Plastoroseomonas hellenica]
MTGPHPDIAALLEMVEVGTESGSRVPLQHLAPDRARADFDASSLLLEVETPPLAHERALLLPMRDGAGIEARLYAPGAPRPGSPLPVLLYMHGGGFVVGSLASHEPLGRRLAAAAGCAVLSVAYRLAPEHKFPTAFEDAEDSLAWIGRHGIEEGLDAARIAIGGDSAGGTLAAALAIAARDDGRHPRPLLQLLAYPGLSAWQDAPSHRAFGKGYLLEQDTIQWFFHQYLRGDADRRDWRFAPLEAPSLAGVAPALIVLPEFDPLVDEGRAYAEKLQCAGVPVELLLYPGMIHEFLRMGNVVDTAGDALAAIAVRLVAAFRGGPGTPAASPVDIETSGSLY